VLRGDFFTFFVWIGFGIFRFWIQDWFFQGSGFRGLIFLVSQGFLVIQDFDLFLFQALGFKLSAFGLFCALTVQIWPDSTP